MGDRFIAAGVVGGMRPMDRSVARIGAWAGWLSLIGILGYHLALTVLAGQRVSGTTDAAAIGAYYGHSVIAVAGVEQFLVIVPVLVFAVALRETVATSPLARLAATVAVAAVVAESAVILIEIAAQAALVSAAQSGEPIVGLFRFWDVLYNSGAYVLEATWVLAFGLAMRGLSVFPRGTLALSVITGALLAINVSAIWVGIPDAATLPSNVFLGLWLAGASIGLRRAAAATRVTAPVLQPA